MKVKVIGSPERGVELVNASTGEAIKGVASISCSIEPGEIVRTRIEFIDCAWDVLPGIVPVCPPNTPGGALVWAPVKAEQPEPDARKYGEGVVLALLDNDNPAGTDTANKLEVDTAAPVTFDNLVGVDEYVTREIVRRFGGG